MSSICANDIEFRFIAWQNIAGRLTCDEIPKELKITYELRPLLPKPLKIFCCKISSEFVATTPIVGSLVAQTVIKNKYFRNIYLLSKYNLLV